MDALKSVIGRLTPFKSWLMGIYLVATTLTIYLTFSHWASDDPFITYRYADNLRRGLGLVYNPGERVLSTTTPLFTLLLALLGFLWPDLPHLANLLGAFGLALGAFFLWHLARSWQTPSVGWAALLLYPTFPLLFTTLGAETTLYLAFCLGAFACYARRNLLLTAAFAGLAVLTRADGALVGLVLTVGFLIGHMQGRDTSRREVAAASNSQYGVIASVFQRSNLLFVTPRLLRRQRTPPRNDQNENCCADADPREENMWNNPWLALLLFLDLVLPWFIFSYWYFGSPFPATLAAKQQQGAMAMSQQFAPGFLTIAGYYAVHWRYRIEALLAAVGVIVLFGRARRWLLFFSWTAIYFIAYSLLGVSRYSWYYAPLVPAFVVLIGFGLSLIAYPPFYRSALSPSPLSSPAPSLPSSPAPQLPSSLAPSLPSSPAPLLLRSLAVLLLLSLAYLQSGDLLRTRQKPDARYPIYRAVGEWLQANTEMTDRVGALEIGIIGYYSRRPMVDFAGLLQPLIADRLSGETSYENAALWAVERYRPSYLALVDGHFPRLEQGYVIQFCALARRFMGSQYGYTANISVYECRR